MTRWRSSWTYTEVTQLFALRMTSARIDAAGHNGDGCGGTLYCPAAQIGRDEMAKFLSNSFSLPLYAP